MQTDRQKTASLRVSEWFPNYKHNQVWKFEKKITENAKKRLIIATYDIITLAQLRVLYKQQYKEINWFLF